MDSKINNIKDILACALMFIKRNNANFSANSNSSNINNKSSTSFINYESKIESNSLNKSSI